MKVAFQFPGQGSQSVGMLSALADRYPLVKATFDEGGEALGYDLWSLVSSGPDDQLDQTEFTQPALLAAGIACWRVWQEENGVEPHVLSGHSLGEYTALVAAGVMGYADGLKLVQLRGQLMQTAVPQGEGAMAAIIGMEDAACRELCASLSSADAVLEAVNFNAPGQVVIAGHAGAVEAGMAQAKAQGARMAKRLPVSVPSHSSLMRDAADQLARALEATDMHPPRIPVIHNVDASAHDDVEGIRQVLAAQLYSPVRWTDCIRQLLKWDCELLIECGPGRVLTGLIRRIERQASTGSLHDPEGFEQAMQAVRGE